jgi:plasmid maintenance system antidote protein VapI
MKGQDDSEAGRLTSTIRRAIAESGIPLLKLSQETGVERMSISRFMAGKRTIRLDAADKLAAYFGLELRKVRSNRKDG